jgi:murein L,D-transpeptidase YafK
MKNQLAKRILFLIVIAQTGLLAMLISGCQKAPSLKVDRTKNTIAMAVSADAPRYANSVYNQADSLLAEAGLEIARQDGRFMIFRDYDRADSLLTEANALALQAINEANQNKNELRIRANDELANLKSELGNWREALTGSLIIYEAERIWSTADLALAACEKLIDMGEYNEALREAENVRGKLQALGGLIEEYSNMQAGKVKTWRKWVKQTVDNSRLNGSAAIIIIKSTHKLYLLRAGKEIMVFNCELGYNSAQQKYFAGDGATPEGTYKITQVNKGSKFYRALMLDYPNENDRRRFSANKAKGIISEQAKIGALIEIHGHAGQNKDWTNGCVALNNDDMDTLIKYAGIGTPVTIVRVSDQWP